MEHFTIDNNGVNQFLFCVVLLRNNNVVVLIQFYPMKKIFINWFTIGRCAKFKISSLIVGHLWQSISMSTTIATIGDMQNVSPSCLWIFNYSDFEFNIEFRTIVIKCLRKLSSSNSNIFAKIFVGCNLLWFAILCQNRIRNKMNMTYTNKGYLKIISVKIILL